MKKQTAVEWLVENLSNLKPEDMTSIFDVRLIIQQALAMEREQILAAANLPIRDRGYDATKFSNIGEQYYSKTYGTQTP